MSEHTRRVPHPASRTPVTPSRLVGHLRQTVHQPDGSILEQHTTLEEKPARRPPHPFRDFMLASTEGLEKIATELGRDLHGRDFRVLFYLLASATFGNFIVPSQSEVARALGLDQGDVNRSFKKLRDLGIIGLDPVSRKNKGTVKRWHLANSLFWKGSAYSLSEARQGEVTEARTRTRTRHAPSAE